MYSCLNLLQQLIDLIFTYCKTTLYENTEYYFYHDLIISRNISCFHNLVYNIFTNLIIFYPLHIFDFFIDTF